MRRLGYAGEIKDERARKNVYTRGRGEKRENAWHAREDRTTTTTERGGKRERERDLAFLGLKYALLVAAPTMKLALGSRRAPGGETFVDASASRAPPPSRRSLFSDKCRGAMTMRCFFVSRERAPYPRHESRAGAREIKGWKSRQGGARRLGARGETG